MYSDAATMRNFIFRYFEVQRINLYSIILYLHTLLGVPFLTSQGALILSLTLACVTGGDCTWQERPRGCLTLRVTKTLYFFFLLLPDDLGSPTTARARGRGGVLKY